MQHSQHFITGRLSLISLKALPSRYGSRQYMSLDYTDTHGTRTGEQNIRRPTDHYLPSSNADSQEKHDLSTYCPLQRKYPSSPSCPAMLVPHLPQLFPPSSAIPRITKLNTALSHTTHAALHGRPSYVSLQAPSSPRHGRFEHVHVLFTGLDHVLRHRFGFEKRAQYTIHYKYGGSSKLVWWIMHRS